MRNSIGYLLVILGFLSPTAQRAQAQSYELLFKQLMAEQPAEAFSAKKVLMDTEGQEYSVQGSVGMFKYTSPNDKTPRTIVYYLPKSIANPHDLNSKQKTLVFLHGGGASTMSDQGATDVAKMYIQDFINYSEEKKVLLIFPTSSFGWNNPTSHFLRNFLKFSKAKIAINEDQLVLSGHSMGGMGITREYPKITDLFSGVLALSAGTQAHMLDEELIVPYLNGTPYTHINGDDDHFQEFKPRMLAFQAKLEAVEKKYNLKSKFKLIFRPGGHNYDLPQTLGELENLFQQPLNRFPKFFQARYEVFHFTASGHDPEVNAIVDSAFWVKLNGFDTKPSTEVESKGVYLMVKVEGQKVILTPKDDELNATSVSLTLSKELLDLKKTVEVSYDGKEIFKGMLPPSTQSDGNVVMELKL